MKISKVTFKCVFFLGLTSPAFAVGSDSVAKPDLLDQFQKEWSQAVYTKPCVKAPCPEVNYATVSVRKQMPPAGFVSNAEQNGIVGEFHVSYDPPLSMAIPYRLTTPVHHPLPGPFIQMIDATPKKSFIRVSMYLFNNLDIKDALVRALQRGVVVQIITSAFYRNDSSSSTSAESAASDKDKEKARIVSEDLGKNIGLANESSFLQFCTKARPGRSKDPGGCLSERLNHQKFVMFSRICRYGLTSNGKCEAMSGVGVHDLYYNNVVAQSSYNFTDAPRHAHEVTSVFLGYDEIYSTYLRYFKYQLKYREEATQIGDFSFKKSLTLARGSSLEINGTPRAKQNAMSYGLLAGSFRGIRCLDEGKKTIIRVGMSHYADKDAVSNEVFGRLKQLKEEGCEVRLILKKNLKAENPDIYARLTKEFDARVVESQMVWDSKQQKNIPANPYANLHAKYVVVETPATNKRIVMFGTLSPHSLSQINTDEMWNVWRNPIEESFQFYKATFDKNFAAAKPAP